jgi:starch synthase
MDTIRYAYNTYRHNSKAWGEMVGRAMDKNFSWNSSAREYEAMYDKICEN